MTMKIDIKEQYIEQFESLLKTLPDDAIEIKKSLDEEINKRSQDCKNGKMKTVPFGTGLNKIREKLTSQL